MTFKELATLVRNEPVFTSGLLKVAGVKSEQIQLQLVRWSKNGQLQKLRRGVYILGEMNRKVEPHPFVVANYLKKASYVSLQSALAYNGLIPEHVPVVTSVTTGRPEKIQTVLGAFLFRHVGKELFQGYKMIEVADRQRAIVATPEKALIDLVYLTPGSDADGYLEELRLQNTEIFKLDILKQGAALSGSAKVMRAIGKLLPILAGKKRT